MSDQLPFAVFSDLESKDIRPKGWGGEIVLHNDSDFCAKILKFTKVGAIGSLHLHKIKNEMFRVLSGKFKVTLINPATAELTHVVLSPTDNVFIKNMTPHQVLCVEPGDILECSSQDFVDDSYRVLAGDTQNNPAFKKES